MKPILQEIWRVQREEWSLLPRPGERPLEVRKALPQEVENLKSEGQVTKGLELQQLLQHPNRPENQQRLETLRNELWDNGIIAAWVSRPDTECLVFKSPKHTINLWGKQGAATDRLLDAQHCFRILEFMGAPEGFVVNWWPIPVKRVTKAGAFPTRAEVNGGWAFRGRPAIWVFREEEWDRVVIHEAIHALGWDVHPSSTVISCLEETLKGDITDALFEAATELNAEWLWAVIHSPPDDTKGVTWERQHEWQMKQAAAILLRNEGGWSEDTSVFAYYVLKAALAIEMERFMVDWLSDSVDTEIWCEYWRAHEKAFYHYSLKHRQTLTTEISTRMTNPALERPHDS